MPVKHDQATRDAAEFRFVVKGESPEAIEQRLGVTASTVRRWAAEHGWNELRRMQRTSPRAIAARLRRAIEKVLDDCDAEERLPSVKDADAIAKLSVVAERLDGETAAASRTLEMLDDLSTFLAEHVPHLMGEITPVITEYAHTVVARVS